MKLFRRPFRRLRQRGDVVDAAVLWSRFDA